MSLAPLPRLRSIDGRPSEGEVPVAGSEPGRGEAPCPGYIVNVR